MTDNNNPPNQISLPEDVYKMYSLFEKISDPKWIDNPFKDYKTIDKIKIKIARNLSNLNYYVVDIPFSDQLNPKYILQYIKNIDYRNYFSCDSISFKHLKEINEHQWKEEEIYLGHRTVFDVQMFNYQIVFYNLKDNLNTNTSEAKYYNSYKILKNNEEYILRFELVLNNMDIDQDIDINVYLHMILNILRAVYSKFKLNFNIINKKSKSPISSSNSRRTKLFDMLLTQKDSEQNINQSKSADCGNKISNDKYEKETQTEFKCDKVSKLDDNKN